VDDTPDDPSDDARLHAHNVHAFINTGGALLAMSGGTRDASFLAGPRPIVSERYDARPCGVGMWAQGSTQINLAADPAAYSHRRCGLIDVDADGIADRIERDQSVLGDGRGNFGPRTAHADEEQIDET
jgi:hypothetical protein